MVVTAPPFKLVVPAETLRLASGVAPPTAPPSVTAPVPAASVSGCALSIMPVAVIAASVVLSVVIAPGPPRSTFPVSATGPAAAAAVVVRLPLSAIEPFAKTDTPPLPVATDARATAFSSDHLGWRNGRGHSRTAFQTRSQLP